MVNVNQRDASFTRSFIANENDVICKKSFGMLRKAVLSKISFRMPLPGAEREKGIWVALGTTTCKA
uniref:Uncharacterized protein n=1 Tax=Picea sitchensis TaxID=3332 RepID=A9NWH1_PICSI|nr:unknown [Picea sitchensis]